MSFLGGNVRAGARWEREELARRRAGTPVVATLQLDLRLTPSERAALAAHLADSATMVRSGYMTGNVHAPTAEVVGMVEAIAAAAGQEGPIKVAVQLDSNQCTKVRNVLRAAQERAGDLRGARDAIETLVAAWERVTGYSQHREDLQAAQPPPIAADEGGWQKIGR